MIAVKDREAQHGWSSSGGNGAGTAPRGLAFHVAKRGLARKGGELFPRAADGETLLRSPVWPGCDRSRRERRLVSRCAEVRRLSAEPAETDGHGPRGVGDGVGGGGGDRVALVDGGGGGGPGR